MLKNSTTFFFISITGQYNIELTVTIIYNQTLHDKTIFQIAVFHSPTGELQIKPRSPVRRAQQVRKATRGSLIGLRAFAPHDLYLASGSNHGPCRAWLGLSRVRVD